MGGIKEKVQAACRLGNVETVYVPQGCAQPGGEGITPTCLPFQTSLPAAASVSPCLPACLLPVGESVYHT